MRAQRPRVGFARHWWARKWLRMLERMGRQSRLNRGRRYAVAGRVLDYGVAPGLVTARVRGSRSRPYQVRIEVAQVVNWDGVLAALECRPALLALLLDGEMPRDIEVAFEQADVTLLPTSGQDLQTSCDCPDRANPCKHVVATHYLVAEAFDQDPFLIFTLRGMPSERLLARLVPLSPTAQPFFAEPGDLASPFDCLIGMGCPGGWVDEGSFRESLAPAYAALSQAAQSGDLLSLPSIDEPEQQVLEWAAEGVLTTAKLAAEWGISARRARSVLSGLVARGLLCQEGSRKATRYRTATFSSRMSLPVTPRR